jgi:predicted PurR-regulated permease PerM
MANGQYWQEGILRYVNGATTMLDQLLQSIQVQFSFLSKTDLSQKMWVEVKDFTEHFSDRYLGDLLLGIAAWLPSLLLTPIITFFLLKDGAYLRKMLGSAVPNAFFEKTLNLMHAVDRTARMYFVGLMKMTVIDTVLMTLGPVVPRLRFATAAGPDGRCAVLDPLPRAAVGAGDRADGRRHRFPRQPAIGLWRIDAIHRHACAG